MLSGDGCLPISHSGEGYRDYPITFCNNKKELVIIFRELFMELFDLQGRISSRIRPNRQEIWTFLKYSRKIATEIKSLGFPEGVKRDVLRVPGHIKVGNESEKLYFILGMLITDGHLLKSQGIRFHLGSKLFIEDLALLISSIIGILKPIKSFVQKNKYISYQLSLNKHEGTLLLSKMPTWDNGTPSALRADFLRDFPVRFRASAYKFI